MREFDAFNPVTRRALSINYIAPDICELVSEASGSGSGMGLSAVLEAQSVDRKAGPELLILDGTTLQWTALPYAFSYVIYRADSADGPFTLLTSNVSDAHFDLASIGLTGTFFFKVTGLEPDIGETLPSPILGPITL